ncbi:FAD-dependent monooxygenase [Mucilaginibacter myungsuensis]|uniref:FAD-dependent monooxygenase n=2 Tax=Mucilaginibacter myungsuensis TaxID=649104 RepID=A0A929L1V1_9SPHI|nr:FAD-dependent monooxygenase [Mucilaginibacter myungsuensis]
MKDKKILVTGASIAGPTLAYWLNRYGFNVTVAERAPELRLGGQNIDVKGPAAEIARKMGIEEAIRAQNTTEVGLRFVNTRNKTVAEFPVESSLSMTQELEILRGDLVRILYDLTKVDVEYRFGEHITQLEQTNANVNVTFSSSRSELFDLVIAAEGIGSKTRELAFAKRPEFKFLGLYTAYLTITRSATDSSWARWCNAENGIVFLLRPDNHGETRASITFTATEDEYKGLSLEEQRSALIGRIRGSGWESERLIMEINKTSDLYFDRISQVKAPEWSEGRVAIVGDAAYCATPIAGKGTDLAMTGAYILAGELYTASTYQKAFEVYEQKMRPYVEKCQQLPPGIPGLVYPRTKIGVGLLNTVVSAFGSRPAKWVFSFFGKDKKAPKQEITLPDYLNTTDRSAN